MSDRSVIILALAVWIGAWLSPSLSRWALIAAIVIAAVAVTAGLVRLNAAALIGGAFVLAATLGSIAWSGLAPPQRPVPVDGEVRLLSDPVDVRGALRVDVRLNNRRVEAWARGDAAAGLRDRMAGEKVTLKGRLVAPSTRARKWLAHRHISTRLQVSEVTGWRKGGVISQIANVTRRTLITGSKSLDESKRPTFAGFVLGDDRGQSEEIASDFRAAGLTHLLVVSGQNVAFVLILIRALVSRLGLRGRWIATMLLLGFILVVTRAEPSVLRAAAMAAIAATAVERGRPVSRIRILALAVAGVVLIDPLLVHVMGFQLSVGASLGIVVLAGPLSERISGPKWLRELIAVTIAAQVGVAPIIIPAFDGLPVASLPANLLAVPAAGPLMMWGLVAGLAAGTLGAPFADVLHMPTSLLISWVTGVAKWASELELGRIEMPQLVSLVVLVGCIWAAHRRFGDSEVPREAIISLIAALMVLVVGSQLLWPKRESIDGIEVTQGANLWRDAKGSVVLVLDGADPLRLLDGLRSRGIGRVDAIVAKQGRGEVVDAVAVLRSRVQVRAVFAPKGHEIRDAIVLPSDSPFVIGELEIMSTSLNGEAISSVTRR